MTPIPSSAEIDEIRQRIIEAYAATWRAKGCEVHVERGRCVVIHPSRQEPKA